MSKRKTTRFQMELDAAAAEMLKRQMEATHSRTGVGYYLELMAFAEMIIRACQERGGADILVRNRLTGREREVLASVFARVQPVQAANDPEKAAPAGPISTVKEPSLD